MPLALVITNAGRAALVNAAGDGTRAVRIAQLGVSPTAIVAAPTTTALPGETKRIDTISGDAVADDIIHLVVRDESMATYTLRSFALYLDDGTLFALYGQPDPIIEKSSQALLLLAVDIALKDISATEIQFGDAAFVLPPATTERLGMVELATDPECIAGTDAGRAVTPKGLFATLTRWLADRLGDVWRASNDGAGSGLDADLLDGRQAADFALLSGSRFVGTVEAPNISATAGTLSAYPAGPVTSIAAATQILVGEATRNPAFGLNVGYWLNQGQWQGTINAIAASVPAPLNIQFSGGPAIFGGSVSASGSITQAGNQVWHTGNDGSGSGLDADLLDGLEATAFIRRAVGSRSLDYDTFGGEMTIRADPGGWDMGYRFLDGAGTRIGGFGAHGGGQTLNFFYVGPTYTAANTLRIYPSRIAWGDATIWHAGNDGAGSGLDADLLDGRHGSEFAALTGATFTGPVSFSGGASFAGVAGFHASRDGNNNPLINFTPGQLIGYNITGGFFDFIVGSNTRMQLSAGALNVAAAILQGGNQVWHLANDGAGSGLDADLLDGRQATDFAPASHGHGAADIAGAFANGLLGDNGYQVLPNGLIIQWCTGAMNGTGSEPTQFIAFPITFPNACFLALPATRIETAGVSADVFYQLVGPPGANGATVQRQYTAQGADTRVTTPLMMAIGR